MKVQMVDLHSQYLKVKPEIDAAIQDVLDTTAFINGPAVRDFADDLGRYLDVPHVIPCANGTDALQIAMMALDLPSGSEILVPSWTYVATVEVIALLGLKPVFVEVDPDNFNIDLEDLKSKVTAKSKAIVPVHLYGQCADMENLEAIAKEFDLFLIEDTAQALGANYTFSSGQKKKAGTMSTIGTTSFFPSKNLGCFGDGGAIFTHDESLAAKIKMIANHGQAKKYINTVVGVNSRLDTLQAAILKVKLKYLDDYAAARNKVANGYDKALNSLSAVQVPKRSMFSDHVFHQYTLKLDSRIDRDSLKDRLAELGVPSMVYYPVPNHLQEAYAYFGFKQGDLPVTESLSQQVISLPIHTEMSEETQNYIIDSVIKCVNQ